ncbi:LapA family protein [Kitasatospora sp. NPDC058965]|uniref:LapA family protein n=1 Tax=Kitasatospora sp. NPDC058965 TaxID=3346682 RepID=UPI0036D15A97
MTDEARKSDHPLIRVKGVAVTGRGLVLTVLGVAMVWFVAANTQSVEVRLWVPTVTAPLWLVLAVTALVAGSVGWFVGRRRLKRAAKG